MSIDKKGDPCRDASPSLLESYNMYGWRPDIDLSVDENFMEVMLLVTRNSTCLQGYMGCILVDSKKLNVYDPNDHDSVDALYHRLVGAIIGVSTNQPLYTVMDSDVHAEIGAIGQAARLGNATAGCTAFITMPPCKTCFGALAAANVKRVVTEREPCQTVLNGANKAGIEIVVLSETSLRRTARVNELTSLGDGLNSSKRSIELQAEIEEKRKRRKELRQEKKRRKQERHERAQLS